MISSKVVARISLISTEYLARYQREIKILIQEKTFKVNALFEMNQYYIIVNEML